MISRSVLLRTRNISDKSCRENQNTRFMFSDFLPKKSWLMTHCRWQYNTAYALFACWIIKAAVHTQNMLFLLLFHGNSGYANAPHCYCIRTMVVLLHILVIYDPVLLLHTHIHILFQRFGGKITSYGYVLWDSKRYRIGSERVRVLPPEM